MFMLSIQEREEVRYRVVIADHSRHTGVVVGRNPAGRSPGPALRHSSPVPDSHQKNVAQGTVQASNLAGWGAKPLVERAHRDCIHPAAHQGRQECYVVVVDTVLADRALNTDRILGSGVAADTMNLAVRMECGELRKCMEHWVD